MTTLTIEGTQTGATEYEVTFCQAGGQPITLYVRPATSRSPYGAWQVKAKPDSGSYVSRHRNFSSAVRSANYRARRYLASCARSRPARQ